MDTHIIRDTRGPGKNKRKWNDEEDAKLIEALLDMANLGKFKAENGFKPGYLNYVEEKLKVVLPHSRLQAKPHIESRIKTLKRDFTIVYDMLNGPNTSGFGMDPIKKCITAKKPVWDAYLKSHPNHSTWKNKSFPFYNDLIIIFGKDRATGANAEGPGDILEEIQKQNNSNSTDDNVEAMMDESLDDFATLCSPLQSPTSEGVHVQKKRKRSAGSDSSTMMAHIEKAASVIGNEIAKASEVFSKAIGVDAQISEKRQQINSEIRKIHGLTGGQVIKVITKIGSRDDLIEIFFSMTDEEEKKKFVSAVINGDI